MFELRKSIENRICTPPEITPASLKIALQATHWRPTGNPLEIGPGYFSGDIPLSVDLTVSLGVSLPPNLSLILGSSDGRRCKRAEKRKKKEEEEERRRGERREGVRVILFVGCTPLHSLGLTRTKERTKRRKMKIKKEELREIRTKKERKVRGYLRGEASLYRQKG